MNGQEILDEVAMAIKRKQGSAFVCSTPTAHTVVKQWYEFKKW